MSETRLKLGVSRCLLGEPVRFDGGHKRNDWVTETLVRWFDLVPVCPEMEIGLGAPRESLRLVQHATQVRLVAVKSGTDHTGAMRTWSARRSAQLAHGGLAGFVLKKDSPSCGMERVRVYGPRDGAPQRNGRGVFAAALANALPLLPLEEEGRLSDARLRENFVTRVFAYSRWTALEAEGVTRAKLFRFHERHKYVLMAHSQTGLRALGHLLGSASKGGDVRALARRYIEHFSAVMARIPTARGHANTLYHVAGYFTEALDTADRAELVETIEQYRQGRLPLVVPITLVRHYVRKHAVRYLSDQVYLNPHPHEMMLLNHV
jgi:uncharacterized protein YbgA (DUF1722 family)/uncharacterized protein YbbK (DUF523 family)